MLDSQLFDQVCLEWLPDEPAKGLYVVFASLGLQLIIILLGFLSHHHRQSGMLCQVLRAAAVAVGS